MRPKTCRAAGCSKPLTQPTGRGRPREFCGPVCKVREIRRRKIECDPPVSAAARAYLDAFEANLRNNNAHTMAEREHALAEMLIYHGVAA